MKRIPCVESETFSFWVINAKSVSENSNFWNYKLYNVSVQKKPIVDPMVHTQSSAANIHLDTISSTHSSLSAF